METPPFILVNCLKTINGEVTGSSGRSVAFPVAKTKDGKYLFATCAHTIVDHLNKGFPLHMLFADGSEVPRVGPMRNNVIPPQLNFDLSFFELDVGKQIGLVRFSSRTVSFGNDLSHVRNVSFREDFGDERFVITTQTSGRSTGKYLYAGNQFLQVDEALKRSLQTMPKCPHKGVVMRSMPGVSGSPLWDKYGNVLGMVSGGTGKLTAESPEYNLVYLPIKQIQACIKSFLRHLV